MPKGLDILKQKIWENLRGKINPRTRKRYTESEAWAIATARWKKSGKELAAPEGLEHEEPQDLVVNTIKEMECV
jgi:hypothetical protein